MHIGLVLAKPPGYSETFFRSKIEGLHKSGFKVTLFVQQKEVGFDLCAQKEAPKAYKNGMALGLSVLGTFFLLLPHFQKVFRFWRLERQTGKDVFRILKNIYLNAHILKSKLDWLHFGFATMALERENLAKSIGAKMAVSFRGYDINVYPLKHPNCYNLLWKRVEKVHSISKYLHNKALKLGLKEEIPYEIITPAVDLEKLPTSEPSGALSSSIQIVTVARLHWMKGLDVSIKAMQLLKAQGVDIRYTIIGEGSKTAFERYAFMAHELGLGDHIHFAGKVSHKDSLQEIAQADIYLQPSLNEGFCNAVLEAQAMGKLCVASKVGGLVENILEGETGYLFGVGDTADLKNVLLEVIGLTSEQRKEMGAKARNRVKQHFNLDQQQKDFIQFYNPNV